MCFFILVFSRHYETTLLVALTGYQFCQFGLLPLFGYAVVMMFSLPPSVGITLLIVVSSPGGSYSK